MFPPSKVSGIAEPVFARKEKKKVEIPLIESFSSNIGNAKALPSMVPLEEPPQTHVSTVVYRVLIPKGTEETGFFLTPEEHPDSFDNLAECVRTPLSLLPSNKKTGKIPPLPMLRCYMDELLFRFCLLLSDRQRAKLNGLKNATMTPVSIKLIGSTVSKLLYDKDLRHVNDIDIRIIMKDLNKDVLCEQAVWVGVALGWALYETMILSPYLDQKEKEDLQKYFLGEGENDHAAAIRRSHFCKLYCDSFEPYGSFVNPLSSSGIHFSISKLDVVIPFNTVTNCATSVSCLDAATLDLSCILDLNYKGLQYVPIRIGPKNIQKILSCLQQGRFEIFEGTIYGPRRLFNIANSMSLLRVIEISVETLQRAQEECSAYCGDQEKFSKEVKKYIARHLIHVPKRCFFFLYHLASLIQQNPHESEEHRKLKRESIFDQMKDMIPGCKGCSAQQMELIIDLWVFLKIQRSTSNVQKNVITFRSSSPTRMIYEEEEEEILTLYLSGDLTTHFLNQLVTAIELDSSKIYRGVAALLHFMHGGKRKRQEEWGNDDFMREGTLFLRSLKEFSKHNREKDRALGMYFFSRCAPRAKGEMATLWLETALSLDDWVESDAMELLWQEAASNDKLHSFFPRVCALLKLIKAGHKEKLSVWMNQLREEMPPSKMVSGQGLAELISFFSSEEEPIFFDYMDIFLFLREQIGDQSELSQNYIGIYKYFLCEMGVIQDSRWNSQLIHWLITDFPLIQRLKATTQSKIIMNIFTNIHYEDAVSLIKHRNFPLLCAFLMRTPQGEQLLVSLSFLCVKEVKHLTEKDVNNAFSYLSLFQDQGMSKEANEIFLEKIQKLLLDPHPLSAICSFVRIYAEINFTEEAWVHLFVKFLLRQLSDVKRIEHIFDEIVLFHHPVLSKNFIESISFSEEIEQIIWSFWVKLPLPMHKGFEYREQYKARMKSDQADLFLIFTKTHSLEEVVKSWITWATSASFEESKEEDTLDLVFFDFKNIVNKYVATAFVKNEKQQKRTFYEMYVFAVKELHKHIREDNRTEWLPGFIKFYQHSLTLMSELNIQKQALSYIKEQIDLICEYKYSIPINICLAQLIECSYSHCSSDSSSDIGIVKAQHLFQAVRPSLKEVDACYLAAWSSYNLVSSVSLEERRILLLIILKSTQETFCFQDSPYLVRSKFLDANSLLKRNSDIDTLVFGEMKYALDQRDILITKIVLSMNSLDPESRQSMREAVEKKINLTKVLKEEITEATKCVQEYEFLDKKRNIIHKYALRIIEEYFHCWMESDTVPTEILMRNREYFDELGQLMEIFVLEERIPYKYIHKIILPLSKRFKDIEDGAQVEAFINAVYFPLFISLRKEVEEGVYDPHILSDLIVNILHYFPKMQEHPRVLLLRKMLGVSLHKRVMFSLNKIQVFHDKSLGDTLVFAYLNIMMFIVHADQKELLLLEDFTNSFDYVIKEMNTMPLYKELLTEDGLALVGIELILAYKKEKRFATEWKRVPLFNIPLGNRKLYTNGLTRQEIEATFVMLFKHLPYNSVMIYEIFKILSTYNPDLASGVITIQYFLPTKKIPNSILSRNIYVATPNRYINESHIKQINMDFKAIIKNYTGDKINILGDYLESMIHYVELSIGTYQQSYACRFIMELIEEYYILLSEEPSPLEIFSLFNIHIQKMMKGWERLFSFKDSSLIREIFPSFKHFFDVLIYRTNMLISRPYEGAPIMHMFLNVVGAFFHSIGLSDTKIVSYPAKDRNLLMKFKEEIKAEIQKKVLVKRHEKHAVFLLEKVKFNLAVFIREDMSEYFCNAFPKVDAEFIDWVDKVLVGKIKSKTPAFAVTLKESKEEKKGRKEVIPKKTSS